MRSAGDSSFLFITGMVRALESRLLDRSIIESMLRAETCDDVINILRNTRYSTFPELNIEPFSADILIKSARSGLFDFIDQHSYDTGAGYLFRLDYDYHNMKILLRKKIFQEERGYLLSDLGNIDVELMTGIFGEEDYNRLPSVMREAVSKAIEEYFRLKRGFVINLIFDRYLFIDMLSSTPAAGSTLIRDFIRRRIDAVNIMALLGLRGKQDVENYGEYLFIDGGTIDAEVFRKVEGGPLKTLSETAMKFDLYGIGSALDGKNHMIYAVERECYRAVMRELIPADYMISGVEPLFAYGCRVDNELKIIGMILSSKFPEFDREIVDTLIQYGG